MPGLLRGMARTAVVAGTATAVSNRVSRRQANKWAAQGGGVSMIDQLKELGELKAQGIHTEEEFAAQKAKLLGN